MKPETIINALGKRGINAKEVTVVKNNVECKAIRIICDENDVISPVVYYSQSETIEEIVEHVKDMLESSKLPEFNIKEIISISYFSKHSYLAIQQISIKDNLVKKRFLNTELYMRIEIEEPINGAVGSIAVTNDFLESINLSEDEAFKIAAKNSENRIEVLPLCEILGEENVFNLPPLYMASTNHSFYGASVLYFPEVFEDICVREGMNKCVILPSSVHEVIVTAGDFTAEELQNLACLVHTINEQDVEPTLRLEAVVYSYDIRNGILKVEATCE